MFVQSCFIRKNTSDIREYLKNLGYKLSDKIEESECIATSSSLGVATGISNKSFDSSNPHATWNCSDRIDCGTNVDLFLSLSALRKDSDKDQWFVHNNSNSFIMCDHDEFHFYSFIDPLESCDIIDLKNSFHKATTKEIIEYFSKL